MKYLPLKHKVEIIILKMFHNKEVLLFNLTKITNMDIYLKQNTIEQACVAGYPSGMYHSSQYIILTAGDN